MATRSKKPVREVMIEHSARVLINDDLISKGFDGNHRFRSVSDALATAQTVLAEHGIEVDEVLSAHRFRGQSGHTLITLAFTNREDLFSPRSIENAGLAFAWHVFQTGRVEAVAYVS